MVDETAARILVIQYLVQHKVKGEITRIAPVSGGWVVFYESAKFLKSGLLSDRFAGNIPFFVDETGKIDLVSVEAVEDMDKFLEDID